jgi:hypothetical protein
VAGYRDGAMFTPITIDPAVCTGRPCIIAHSIIVVERECMRRRRLPIA